MPKSQRKQISKAEDCIHKATDHFDDVLSDTIEYTPSRDFDKLEAAVDKWSLHGLSLVRQFQTMLKQRGIQ